MNNTKPPISTVRSKILKSEESGAAGGILSNKVRPLMIYTKRQTGWDIPVYCGDPLDFRLFLKAFEHTVDSRTDNSTDISCT